MKIRIIETGEIKDLTIKDQNGIEYTYDLITASDFYNKETEEHEMSQDDFDWWEEYINNYRADQEEIKELAEELEIEESEINDRIQKELKHVNDMEDHHIVIQSVLKEIREENKQ